MNRIDEVYKTIKKYPVPAPLKQTLTDLMLAGQWTEAASISKYLLENATIVYKDDKRRANLKRDAEIINSFIIERVEYGERVYKKIFGEYV